MPNVLYLQQTAAECMVSGRSAQGLLEHCLRKEII